MPKPALLAAMRTSPDVPPRRPTGFTLIELLVTIGIVCVLAALLAPSLTKAMDSSKAADCTGNLRQIGAAFQLYLPDHNNVLPQRVYQSAQTNGVQLGYDELLAPYVANGTKIFQCRSHTTKDYPNEPSYGMNWYYDNASLGVVENLAGTILATETLGENGTGSHRADRDSGSPGELDSERHQGKANYLFFDGHVERLEFDQTIEPVDRWGVDQNMHDMAPPGS